MFQKIIELIKQALRSMVKYKDVTETVTSDSVYTIDSAMRNAVDLWKSIYQDEAPWLNEEEGIYSLNIGQQICQELCNQVLAEMEMKVSATGEPTSEEEENPNTRAYYINQILKKHLQPRLSEQVEKGMAIGSGVFKPYINGNEIFIDFTLQGDFVPLQFDDDGNITDIAFIDQLVNDDKIYTKVERQVFNSAVQTVTVTNKVFVAKNRENEDVAQELGIEIPITNIEKWKDIEPEVTIENVTQPLYGVYKVPLANKISLKSPLGVSVFSPAVKMIQRTDKQFSRLDWEYEGGQIAIDVDAGALRGVPTGYYGGTQQMDSCKRRLYRTIDLGVDETYNAFAPSLRDGAYLSGLNAYLKRIEDLCGLARGTIAEVEGDAKTASEIKILKQRTYMTITGHQSAIETAINNLVYAIDVYASLYNLAPMGKYNLNIEWSDSVLTDVETELNQRVQLKQENVISAAELRAWYLGEDIETAEANVKQIQEDNNSGLDDIFTMNKMTGVDNNPSLEDEGE